MDYDQAQIREIAHAIRPDRHLLHRRSGRGPSRPVLAIAAEYRGHARRDEHARAIRARRAAGRPLGGQHDDGHPVAVQADQRVVQVGHGVDRAADRDPGQGGQLPLEYRSEARRRDPHRAGGAAPRGGLVELHQRRGDLRRRAVDRDQRRQHLVHEDAAARIRSTPSSRGPSGPAPNAARSRCNRSAQARRRRSRSSASRARCSNMPPRSIRAPSGGRPTAGWRFRRCGRSGSTTTRSGPMP